MSERPDDGDQQSAEQPPLRRALPGGVRWCGRGDGAASELYRYSFPLWPVSFLPILVMLAGSFVVVVGRFD